MVNFSVGIAWSTLGLLRGVRGNAAEQAKLAAFSNTQGQYGPADLVSETAKQEAENFIHMARSVFGQLDAPSIADRLGRCEFCLNYSPKWDALSSDVATLIEVIEDEL